MFSGGVERDQWHKMSQCARDIRCVIIHISSLLVVFCDQMVYLILSLRVKFLTTCQCHNYFLLLQY